MHGNKSLRPDDMSPIFYKHFWSTIGPDVISAVQNFVVGGSMPKAANHTFLALIPKRPATNKVEQFRPIALCNVIYKIITKIIVGRLKWHLDKLIHPSQSAFVPSRSILDNNIINHEVMSYLNAKKGKKSFMAIEVDMAKAYDMVEWDVLKRVLQTHGFQDEFCNLVYSCISSAHFSILLNGSLVGFFQSSRGIRQGDPLSPALFTIMADLLSRILARAADDVTISWIEISRTSPLITHLMYVDASEIKRCLAMYCKWTGQRIN